MPIEPVRPSLIISMASHIRDNELAKFFRYLRALTKPFFETGYCLVQQHAKTIDGGKALGLRLFQNRVSKGT